MDIIYEIISNQGTHIRDSELDRLLELLGHLKTTKAKKEALRVLYASVELDAKQFQSIVDHASIRKVSELVRFAQKQARHFTYRTTQQHIIENERVSPMRAFWLTLIIIGLATAAAFLVPQISELFL